jgi:hypothetical protein
MNGEAAGIRLELDSALKRSRSQSKAADSLQSADRYNLHMRKARRMQGDMMAKVAHVRSNAWCQQHPFSVAEPFYLALSSTVARLKHTLRTIDVLKEYHLWMFPSRSWYGPQKSLMLAAQCNSEMVTDAGDWIALRYYRASKFPNSFSNGETACMKRIYSWVFTRVTYGDQRRKGSNPMGSLLHSEKQQRSSED